MELYSNFRSSCPSAKSVCLANVLFKMYITSKTTLHVYPHREVGGLKYLHSFDVPPAHAAAAVDEEYEFAVDLPQVRADGFEVRAEVDHDHRVVEDVFMQPPVNDVYLERRREK